MSFPTQLHLVNIGQSKNIETNSEIFVSVNTDETTQPDSGEKEPDFEV
jgi:hypothetical protein